MPIPALERGCAGDAGGLGIDVDRSVGNHLGEAREAVEAVGVDAVAGGLGEETRAQGGAVAAQTKVLGRAVEGGVEIGVGDAKHGSVDYMRWVWWRAMRRLAVGE